VSGDYDDIDAGLVKFIGGVGCLGLVVGVALAVALPKLWGWLMPIIHEATR